MGDVVEDEVEVAIPPDLPADEYTLAGGMYDPATLRRLPLLDGPTLGDNRILLARMSVVR